jgi:hypothetical protein
VAHLIQEEQTGARDLLRQCECVAVWKQGILGSMNHERRDPHLAKALPPTIASVEHKRIRHARRNVGSAIEDPCGEVTHGGFVEGPRTSCKGALGIDHVVNHRRSIRPVWFHRPSREEGPELL